MGSNLFRLLAMFWGATIRNLKAGGRGYVAELEAECVAIRYDLKVGKKAINETEQKGKCPFAP